MGPWDRYKQNHWSPSTPNSGRWLSVFEGSRSVQRCIKYLWVTVKTGYKWGERCNNATTASGRGLLGLDRRHLLKALDTHAHHSLADRYYTGCCFMLGGVFLEGYDLFVTSRMISDMGGWAPGREKTRTDTKGYCVILIREKCIKCHERNVQNFAWP